MAEHEDLADIPTRIRDTEQRLDAIEKHLAGLAIATGVSSPKREATTPEPV